VLLRYLHGFEPPILHLDLKPANLLITAKLDVKICDFGLSRTQLSVEKEGEMPARTVYKGVEGGTAPYSAPEVLLGKDIDKGADVFAFGVVLCEIYTRKRPWFGVHAARISQLVGFEDKRLPMPEEMRELPKMMALLEACWKLRPVERPPFHKIIEIVDGALSK